MKHFKVRQEYNGWRYYTVTSSGYATPPDGELDEPKYESPIFKTSEECFKDARDRGLIYWYDFQG